MRRQSAILIGCVLAGVFASSGVEAKRYQKWRVAHAHSTKVKTFADQPPAEAAPGQTVANQAIASLPVASARNPPLPPLLAAIFQPASAPTPPTTTMVQPAAAEAAQASADEARHTVVAGGSPLQNLVAKHAVANGIPFSLAHAVIMIESKYSARVAHAGNYGLMQIRAETARGMGFSGSAVGLLDPETNLRFGMKYLALAYRMAKGDTCGTVMRYQSGVGTTRMSASNRAYCARARSYMAHL